jgi:hypothetical protein
MAMNQSYSLTVESDEYVVRFRRDLIDKETVSQFLEFIELESIRKRSRLTQKPAEALADEADRAGWERLGPTFARS